jgi:cellulose synthase/poly-beta-1,6-N-acetylglucosamine synthase-like glycosyltransferase
MIISITAFAPGHNEAKRTRSIIESLLPQMHKVDVVVINEDNIDNRIIS